MCENTSESYDRVSKQAKERASIQTTTTSMKQPTSVRWYALHYQKRKNERDNEVMLFPFRFPSFPFIPFLAYIFILLLIFPVSHSNTHSHTRSERERGTENIINVFRYFVLFSSLRWLFSGPFYMCEWVSVCNNYYVLAWILLIKESGCWFNWIFFSMCFVHLSHTLPLSVLLLLTACHSTTV